MNGYQTVYHDQFAGRISALAHEMGHNFNLAHAGANGNPYGDTSGYMGYGSLSVHSPVNCFNAQKHWQFGWYSDRTLSLTMSDLPWGGYVAAFVDYNLTKSDQYVVVSVMKPNLRIFLQYNRAKGMNAQTRSHADEVVIIRDSGATPQVTALQSWLDGAIMIDDGTVSPVYRRPNFRGVDGSALVVTVCSKTQGPPDLVRLSIHLDNGTQTNTCASTPKPAQLLPMSRPSIQPAMTLTGKPTLHPTAQPTNPQSSPMHLTP